MSRTTGITSERDHKPRTLRRMTMSELYQLPADIRNEFTVDADGKIWASARATARLAGIDHTSLIKKPGGLLTRLLVGKTLPECLKPFLGFDYWAVGKIPDILVSAIVTYYAYEANVTNNQAKKVASAMQAVGFRVFFQTGLGLEKPTDQEALHKALKQVLENQVIQSQYFNERISSVEEGIKARLAAEYHYSGVGEIINDLIAPVKLLPPSELTEPFTMKEYTQIVHNVALTKSESISLGRFTVDAYSAINLQKPEFNAGTNKFEYRHRDLIALKVIFQTWLAIKTKKAS